MALTTNLNLTLLIRHIIAREVIIARHHLVDNLGSEFMKVLEPSALSLPRKNNSSVKLAVHIIELHNVHTLWLPLMLQIHVCFYFPVHKQSKIQETIES